VKFARYEGTTAMKWISFAALVREREREREWAKVVHVLCCVERAENCKTVEPKLCWLG